MHGERGCRGCYRCSSRCRGSGCTVAGLTVMSPYMREDFEGAGDTRGGERTTTREVDTLTFGERRRHLARESEVACLSGDIRIQVCVSSGGEHRDWRQCLYWTGEDLINIFIISPTADVSHPRSIFLRPSRMHRPIPGSLSPSTQDP